MAANPLQIYSIANLDDYISGLLMQVSDSLLIDSRPELFADVQHNLQRFLQLLTQAQLQCHQCPLFHNAVQSENRNEFLIPNDSTSFLRVCPHKFIEHVELLRLFSFNLGAGDFEQDQIYPTFHDCVNINQVMYGMDPLPRMIACAQGHIQSPFQFCNQNECAICKDRSLHRIQSTRQPRVPLDFQRWLACFRATKSHEHATELLAAFAYNSFRHIREIDLTPVYEQNLQQFQLQVAQSYQLALYRKYNKEADSRDCEVDRQLQIFPLPVALYTLSIQRNKQLHCGVVHDSDFDSASVVDLYIDFSSESENLDAILSEPDQEPEPWYPDLPDFY